MSDSLNDNEATGLKTTERLHMDERKDLLVPMMHNMEQ